MARLKISQDQSQDNGELQILELDPETEVRIGRGAENEVVLDDPRSSRVHAILNFEEGEWVLHDQGSRNGTRLNGKPVSEAKLMDGDRIVIGKASLEFDTGAGSKKAKPGSKEAEPGVAAAGKGPNQRVFLLAAGVIVGLGLLLVLFSSPNKGAQPPIPLPAPDAVGVIPNGDQEHSTNAVFLYEAPAQLPKALELHYKAYDIDKDNEIKVYLNGKPIFSLPMTGDGLWSSERRLEIPRDLLKPGEKNYLVFQHSYNKPDEPPAFAWGISDLKISELIPVPCNLKSAEDQFKLGSKLYSDRRVLASNLFQAIQKLEGALASSKECTPKPIFYTDATARLLEARAELNDAYRAIKIEFTRARKLNRIDECQMYISRLQQMIPDEEDPRYIEALRWKRTLPGAQNQDQSNGSMF